MKVARFDVAKAVAINTGVDTCVGRYGRVLPVWLPVKLSGSQQREPFDLGVLETHNSSLIHPDFVHKECNPERKYLKRRFPPLVVIRC
jgi:hypothetical protein